MWCGAVHYYVRCTITCGAVMPFCRRFWCSLCGLVNTPNCSGSSDVKGVMARTKIKMI